jgi:hypothetical protein
MNNENCQRPPLLKDIQTQNYKIVLVVFFIVFQFTNTFIQFGENRVLLRENKH